MSNATFRVESAHRGDEAFRGGAGEALRLAEHDEAEQVDLHDTIGMLAGEAAPITEPRLDEISSITREIAATLQPSSPARLLIEVQAQHGLGDGLPRQEHVGGVDPSEPCAPEEPLGNRAFTATSEVETELEDRRVRLSDMPDVIRAHTFSTGGRDLSNE